MGHSSIVKATIKYKGESQILLEYNICIIRIRIRFILLFTERRICSNKKKMDCNDSHLKN